MFRMLARKPVRYHGICAIRNLRAGLRHFEHPWRSAGDLTNSRAIIDACRPFHWKDEFQKVNAPTPEMKRAAWQKWGHLRGD